MSKYDNYGSFMLAVLDEADKKCNNTIYMEALSGF